MAKICGYRTIKAGKTKRRCMPKPAKKGDTEIFISILGLKFAKVQKLI